MLDKLKFNNLVISNKKGIQQSRIQTINKLVHKIRKLKTLLEKHPDNTKCKERIRKSTETMEILKKLKRVDIMKKVLLLDKPAPAVITNGLSTPEEVGVALLTMNKVMQGLIKRFKTELQLHETENDEWKQALMENSKRRQKIERTEEKRRKRLEMKQQKILGRKRQEWLEENQKGLEIEKVTDGTELNVSTTGPWQVEELSVENAINEDNKNVESNSNKSIKRTIKESPLKMKTSSVPNKKQKLSIENNNESKKFVVKSENEEESEIEFKTNHGKTNLNQDESYSHSEEEEEAEEDLVVDPFFITDTGENYLSTAVIKRNQNVENEDNDEKMDLHMIKLNNSDKKPVDFRERRQQNRNNNQKDFNQNKNKWSKGEERGQQNKFAQSKWNDKKNPPRPNQKSINKGEEEKLHPSWAAKQKLKPVITGFQGKKITFGDNDDDNQTPNQPQQQAQNKTATHKSAKSEQDSLHPSWAAKQKLKPTITAFQGKKITFDNDD